MPVQFRNPILFVRDMEASKAFYNGLLGIGIKEDLDTFVLLEGNLGLHRADLFYEYLQKPYSGEAMGRDNLDLYFTSDHLPELQQRLIDAGFEVFFPLQLTAWGETLFRVYDPDRHIVEIGDKAHE
jgi:catechol 2,3-dioxygenase-like lactoylglutathione lyase family enzyme